MSDKKRKSFVLHIDVLSVLDDLNDEQAGRLFKAILANRKGEGVEIDTLTKIAMSPFKAQFDRDDEKYQNIVERNKNNGLKGGRPKTQENQDKPTGLSGNSGKPKKADSDSDSVKDSDSDKEKEEIKDITPAKLSLDFSVLGFLDNQIDDLKRIRKANKGTKLTQRIVNALAKEFHNATSKGYSIDELLTEWEVRGWKSFKNEWIKPNPNMQRVMSEAAMKTLDAGNRPAPQLRGLNYDPE